jgi:hypothetical protein
VQLRLLPKAHFPWLTKLKAQARKVTVSKFVCEGEVPADVLKLHVEVINGPSCAGVEGPHDRHLVLQLLVGADPELAAPRSIARSVLDAPHLGLGGARIPAPHVGRGAHDDQRIAG